MVGEVVKKEDYLSLPAFTRVDKNESLIHVENIIHLDLNGND
jgi:hypothetical protein